MESNFRFHLLRQNVHSRYVSFTSAVIHTVKCPTAVIMKYQVDQSNLCTRTNPININYGWFYDKTPDLRRKIKAFLSRIIVQHTHQMLNLSTNHLLHLYLLLSNDCYYTPRANKPVITETCTHSGARLQHTCGQASSSVCANESLQFPRLSLLHALTRCVMTACQHKPTTIQH